MDLIELFWDCNTGLWLAQFKDEPDLSMHGDTQEEAIRNLLYQCRKHDLRRGELLGPS